MAGCAGDYRVLYIHRGAGEMTSHTITVPGPMIGKARARVTRNGTYTPATTRAKEQEIGWLAKATGCTPIVAGACQLRVAITVEPPKSWPKGLRADACNQVIFPTSKPDLDNCVKLIGDALNGIAWLDDSQVVQVIATKLFGPVCKTEISWGAA